MVACPPVIPTTANDAQGAAAGIRLPRLAEPAPAPAAGQIGVRHELLLADADEDAEALEADVAGETPAVYSSA